ncbi:MAG: DUF1638 domain-containing protein [Chloroflexota bacterium]|nr:DUF1638 domain-containing protein [Chloroflexota bacterium]
MRLKCIACDVLARPIYLCAAQSPHIVDVDLLERGLHDHPKVLRAELQSRVDQSQQYDAVLLGYGLCGQATAGLKAGDRPIVIPRAHDCITLFLGSRQRYDAQFETQPGTYWYALDYVERGNGAGGSMALGANTGDDAGNIYAEYVEKYGKDNADYLMEVMGEWQAHYQRAAFVDMEIGDSSQVESEARAAAKRRGWAFEKLTGNLVLIRRLLNGDWNEDFLTLQPGQDLIMTYDEDIVGCSLVEH